MNQIKLLKKLVSIDSQNPNSDEYQIVKYISFLLKKYNISHKIIKSKYRRFNIIGSLNSFDSTKRTLVFNGHLDTKPANEGWLTNPLIPTLKENKLYGLGTADMKSGVAAILFTLIEVKRKKYKLKGNINFQFVADEEMNSKFGMQYLVKKNKIKKADFAIVAEPTEMKIVTKSLGNMRLKVIMLGKSAHAGKYWKGINIIDIASIFINKINQKFKQFKQKYKDEFSPFFPNCNIGYINAGLHPGSVPSNCEILLDIRFQNEKQRKVYYNLLIDVLNILKDNYNISFQVLKNEEDMYAWRINKKQNSIKKIFNIIEKSYIKFSIPLRYDIFYGGSDAGILNTKLHTPTIIIGPGSLNQAHKENEYVEIEQYLNAIKLYKDIILDWR